MKNRFLLLLVGLSIAGTGFAQPSPPGRAFNSAPTTHPFNTSSTTRPFNTPYTGLYLQRIAFPIGGIGAGMFCLEGTGAISHLSIHHRPEVYNEPPLFAAVAVKGHPNGAK